jgi:DDE domain
MKNAVPALLLGQHDGALGPDGTWLPAFPVPELRAGLQWADRLGAEPVSAANRRGFSDRAVAVTGTTPDKVITDKHASYPPALDEVFCNDLEYRTSKYLDNHPEQDHRAVKGRYRPMRGFQTHTSAARDEVCDFFRPPVAIHISRSDFGQQASDQVRQFFVLKLQQHRTI